jgi:signal transduction histidine kinase
MITMSSGPLRWLRDTTIGYCRSAVLVAVAGLIPALTIAVAVFGLSFSRSWSAHLHAPPPVRLAAAIGEWALAALWTAMGFSVLMAALGRSTAQFLRRYGGRWLGAEIPSPYRPPRPVTRMSTGYWWNGHGYHETEREAKIATWLTDHSVVASIRNGERDPQLLRDVSWQAVAAVTVVPVAALPLLAGVGAIYEAAATQSILWATLLAVASVASAPFAWRILSFVAPRCLAPSTNVRAEEHVARLSSIRADLTQTQAAELERIERSLHDGAQARMVALGMHLSAAEQLVDTDPEQAKHILREARASSVIALDQLRTLVRGINPPVLVERGLVDAIRALALDAPVEVDVRSTIEGRPERPVEAALYFAVAELLTNVVKHSHATHAALELSHRRGVVWVVVSDNGTGSAAAAAGSGLDGIARRLAAFEGQVSVDSPAGGPTRVTLTVPCALS